MLATGVITQHLANEPDASYADGAFTALVPTLAEMFFTDFAPEETIMSTMNPVRAATVEQTAGPEGARLLVEQAQTYAAEPRAVDPADWSRPTDCTTWDVRQIAAHVTGALDEGAGGARVVC